MPTLIPKAENTMKFLSRSVLAIALLTVLTSAASASWFYYRPGNYYTLGGPHGYPYYGGYGYPGYGYYPGYMYYPNSYTYPTPFAYFGPAGYGHWIYGYMNDYLHGGIYGYYTRPGSYA